MPRDDQPSELEDPQAESVSEADQPPADGDDPDATSAEIGGRAGPEPTRYGDWEKAGRCIDF